MSEVWGLCVFFGRPPDWDIGFVSFVRASGRGKAAWLRVRVREIMLLYAGLSILELFSASLRFFFAYRLLRFINIP